MRAAQKAAETAAQRTAQQTAQAAAERATVEEMRRQVRMRRRANHEADLEQMAAERVAARKAQEAAVARAEEMKVVEEEQARQERAAQVRAASLARRAEAAKKAARMGSSQEQVLAEAERRLTRCTVALAKRDDVIRVRAERGSNSKRNSLEIRSPNLGWRARTTPVPSSPRHGVLLIFMRTVRAHLILAWHHSAACCVPFDHFVVLISQSLKEQMGALFPPVCADARKHNTLGTPCTQHVR